MFLHKVISLNQSFYSKLFLIHYYLFIAHLAHVDSPVVSIEKEEAISKYINKIHEAVIPLHELLIDTPGDYILNSLVIKQQINILCSAFHNNKETSSSDQPMNGPSSSDQHMNETSSSDQPSTSLIQNILKLPEPLKRKTKRKYKIINYGIFTSEEVLNDISNIEKEKEKKELEKEEKRKLREQQKEMQETIKRIKKEKVAEKKENKVKELEAKKQMQANRMAMIKENKGTQMEKSATIQNQLDLKKKRGRPSKKTMES